ncbi:hypothetical protein Poly30_04710 [Planctomycetes bacterium Poly30]|uniref:Alpha-galactosidase n=1 Tax=Saltatorellus ferox TaxID=2528018 RepID=A0A518ELK2_9BACT|nr:hypothetical protein Poly30_04710 [Planctomycetes bacterium Poly30]
MLLSLILCAQVAGVSSLEVLPSDRVHPGSTDWLTQPAPWKAGVFRNGGSTQIYLDNGLLRRTFLLGPGDEPGLATIALDDLGFCGKSWLRDIAPEAVIEIDGERLEVGGAKAPAGGAFLDPAWVRAVEAGERALEGEGARAFRLVGVRTGPIGDAGITWVPNAVRHCAPDAVWPPEGIEFTLNFEPTDPSAGGAFVSVHHALFDGLPAYAKWITVENRGVEPFVIDSITTETLRVVEHSSWVETRGVAQPVPSLHVETDFAFGGMTYHNANSHVVRWKVDPTFQSQVNYERKTPCLLEVSPAIGPAATVAPGEAFTSYRTYVLSTHEEEGRERNGMARRRLMRTVAPWVTENPLMMHVRWSDWDTVKNAIDQCAEVGFEMVILTFGSGFNIENQSPEYLAEMKRYADYAASKGIEIGGYSLLSSRRIEPAGDNCIHPETGEPGAEIHGSCPSLTSAWGQAYFDTLESFYAATGFMLLEHDGSYPGTPDAAERLPLQTGLKNSVWAQWKVIDEFYRWCRGCGIYLNVPDHYYHAGANKCGMGYREVNWSLPRAAQVLHTRQNIFDGTWTKTPSMGWMFVPLTEYQGGGAAATIEPLAEHLDHYRQMLISNLAMGVQACYRGPRLYDTEATRDVVKDAVSWFKKHRRLLESDLVHGRRADGRDLDWMLHADPFAPEGEPRGMLVIFNPLDEPIERALKIPLDLTGIRQTTKTSGPALLHPGNQELEGLHVTLSVQVPARAMSWAYLH